METTLSRLRITFNRLPMMTGWALFDQLWVSGLNFFVAIALAHVLGMSAFGQFSLILIIGFFCQDVQRALITAPYMNFFTQDKSNTYQRDVIFLQFCLSMLLSIMVMVFIALTGQFVPQWQIAPFAFAGGLFVACRMTQEFLRRLYFAHDMPGRALKLDMAVGILLITGLLFFHYKGTLTVTTALAAYITAGAIGISSSYLSLGFQSETASAVFSIYQIIVRHARYGVWLFAALLVTYASSNILILIGSAVLGSEAAGIVKTAQYTMGGMIILFQAMETIVPPKLASLIREKHPKEQKVALLTMLGAITGFWALHVLLIFIFLAPITHWLAPENKMDFIIAVAVTIGLTGILVLNNFAQYLFRALEETKTVFLANLASTIFCIVFGPVLIGRLGFSGLMAGLVLAQLISTTFYLPCILSLWKRIWS